MKGINFKPDMHKAIMEGRKTVTRRVIKPQPPIYADSAELRPSGIWMFFKAENPDFHAYLRRRPRYLPGETVYVREALFRHPYLDEAGYTLDQSPVFVRQTVGDMLRWRWQKDTLSAMFCPEEAARTFLKILDVRPERVQEITEEDAIREGMTKQEMAYDTAPIWQYQELWDRINPKSPWSMNPFVFRYEFERTERPK